MNTMEVAEGIAVVRSSKRQARRYIKLRDYVAGLVGTCPRCQGHNIALWSARARRDECEVQIMPELLCLDCDDAGRPDKWWCVYLTVHVDPEGDDAADAIIQEISG